MPDRTIPAARPIDARRRQIPCTNTCPTIPVPRVRRRAALAVLTLAATTLAVAGTVSASTAPPSSPPGATASAATAGTSAAAPDTGANPSGCVDDVAAGTNLFPDQFTVQHAENYTLTYADTYKVLTVGETSPGAGSHTYVLVQCGTDAPELTGDLDGAEVVTIPVTTMFSESTSHDGFIDVLGLSGLVTGVADGSWVVTPSIKSRIDAGEVDSFNTTGQIDTELVIADDPDVYLTGGYDDPAQQVIVDAGIPVVANAEWLETSPQGWAEWVGVFAALTNTEARATELYDGWVADYDEAAAVAAGVADRPTVLTGSMYEGTWYASGGAGIAARFIADAGGDYVYADDTSTGSITLDIEQVLVDGADAQVWVNPTAGFTDEASAVGMDSRYGEFGAWADGGVWSNATPPDPSISFIEQGPVRIADYLRDYIQIFHPELEPDRDLVFYTQLPAS